MNTAPARIPVTLLTGFLGAGKTTLLNRLLKHPETADTAVLINEFGEVGLDHLLVERLDDDTILLNAGCLCCTIRGDLAIALGDLAARALADRPLRRVIIETTGLADPAPILQTLMADPLLLRDFVLDGVVTVVDAVNGAATLDTQPEAVRQVAVADRILLTKTDIAEAQAAFRRGALSKRERCLGMATAPPLAIWWPERGWSAPPAATVCARRLVAAPNVCAKWLALENSTAAATSLTENSEPAGSSRARAMRSP